MLLTRLNETRELLKTLREENLASKQGRPIPDSAWKEVSGELDSIEKDYLRLLVLFVFFIIVAFIF